MSVTRILLLKLQVIDNGFFLKTKFLFFKKKSNAVTILYGNVSQYYYLLNMYL
jgi:hypothetical protein